MDEPHLPANAVGFSTESDPVAGLHWAYSLSRSL